MTFSAAVLNQEAWPCGRRLSRRKIRNLKKLSDHSVPLRKGQLLSSFENHSSLGSIKVCPFHTVHGISSLKAFSVFSLDLGSALVQSLFQCVCFRSMLMGKFLERLVIISRSLCSFPTLSPVCCTCYIHSSY